MIHDQELHDLHEDFISLLQITNPDQQEDIRLKKICIAIMTLSRRLSALNDREGRNVLGRRAILREMREDIDRLLRREFI